MLYRQFRQSGWPDAQSRQDRRVDRQLRCLQRMHNRACAAAPLPGAEPLPAPAVARADIAQHGAGGLSESPIYQTGVQGSHDRPGQKARVHVAAATLMFVAWEA